MATTPPQDTHARAVKRLDSQARKLRAWVTSDAAHLSDFVDVLLELTALRLSEGAFSEAVADAQEALAQANALVLEHGAPGPFTPADDAVRFVTATTHVSVLQRGVGQVEAAGQTAEAALAWLARLPHLAIGADLAPRTTAWLLGSLGRAALAGGDVDRANAWADAALLRARHADAAVTADALTLVAECRWAGRLPQDAVAAAAEARALRAEVAEPVLAASIGVKPALVERLVTPLVAASADLAARQTAVGDAAGAAAERAALVEEVAPLRERHPAIARALDAEPLALALPEPGPQASWTPLVVAELEHVVAPEPEVVAEPDVVAEPAPVIDTVEVPQPPVTDPVVAPKPVAEPAVEEPVVTPEPEPTPEPPVAAASEPEASEGEPAASEDAPRERKGLFGALARRFGR